MLRILTLITTSTLKLRLTSVLSEQIALEIDQEILSDLVSGANGATLYWSRLPGKFVNREDGSILGSSLFPDFTGTVSEWYETLLETINEVSARIHRKTLAWWCQLSSSSRPRWLTFLSSLADSVLRPPLTKRVEIGELSKSARLAARWISTLILTSSETSFWLDARATASLKAAMFMLRMSHCKSRRPFLVPKTSCPARA